MLKHKAVCWAAWLGFCLLVGVPKVRFKRCVSGPLWVALCATVGVVFYLTSVTNCALGRRTFFKLVNQSPSLAR